MDAAQLVDALIAAGVSEVRHGPVALRRDDVDPRGVEPALAGG